MTTAAVIVAAGRGIRAGGPAPKQYQTLGTAPVLAHTLRAFLRHPAIDRVVVVVSGEDRPRFLADVAPHLDGADMCLTEGGDSRAASVRAGLLALAEDPPDRVLIHDGARACVSAAVISRVIDALTLGAAAAPALSVTDTLWRGQGQTVTGITDRDGLFRAQTPQGFRFAEILAAHETADGTETDDVEVAMKSGLAVQIVDGDEDNLKITRPEDFHRAARNLGAQMDIRTGNGFDVHAFAPGDHVTLCGIDIPHDKALSGHSDADVALHVITDAIYGALAEGDIGQWFPPSDPQWKGAASDIFLTHAVALAAERGFTITHSDCTIICEAPKIGPHALAMRAKLAQILGIEASRVSVKATTTEQLGFTGRKEGIAAMATVTLVRV